MIAFTDYPIRELGDKEFTKAPVRKVTVMDYDLNKYCKVKVEGVVKTIKAGYLYTQEGRHGDVPLIDPNGAAVKS